MRHPATGKDTYKFENIHITYKEPMLTVRKSTGELLVNRALLLEVSYGGSDTCIEPNSQIHVVPLSKRK
ncbi:MAG: hypothetical protein GY854_10075 [Deltaproteobacteria bacterium]|nr:hypothetical protein [Deltaproteobacteria bacterium]